jgi:hypothetical protein
LVSPTTTTTYTLTATNANGSSSASVIVSVGVTSRPGNGIVITDQSGAGQTNRPFTISRVFAQGEFPAGTYPLARIGGAGGLTVLTQVDVKNTWSDGSIRHAMLSFAASVPASGSLAVDFVAQATSNNSGNLDRSGMLNYNNGNWGADIEATNGATLKADARAMLTAWNGVDSGINGSGVRYWLKGPVVTQVIVEDRSSSLTYDLGWDSAKPLHPIFVLTFYPGSGLGVKVESIVENMWTTKLEDQSYSLALKTGNPLNTTVYTKSTFTHVAQSRWRKVYWSGTAPTGWKDEGHPGINVDLNLAYIAASKAVPNFDLTKVVPASTISGDVSNFNSSDRGDINGFALWTQYMPQTGGRPDLGVIPVWYVRYLYSMNPDMYALMLGSAEVSGYVPYHLRESASGKFFDSARTVPAFGRPISISARPTVYVPQMSFSGQASSDMIMPIGPVTQDGWTVDLAHEPAFAYIPYLVTGDWYFLEEVYFLATYDLASIAPGTDVYTRHNDWGWFNDLGIQTRGQAWGRRDIAEGGFIAPDGTPEKAYFTEKVNNNLAIEEGYLNTTTGVFYQPCSTSPYDPIAETSKWCWGRKSPAMGWPNPLHYGSLGGTDSTFILDSDLVPQTDPNSASYGDRPWETLYKLNVSGHVQELGYPASGANGTAFKYLINILANPAFNPYLCGAYTMATASNAGKMFYQDWGTLLLSFNPAYNGTVNLRTVSYWWDPNSDDTAGDGYPHICQAAASYLPGLSDGAFTGASAWGWTVSHISAAPLNDNPQFAILPR